MARITVEDCLKKVNNRFSLIHMASKRVRQLRKGAEATLITKNRDIVTALREIAAGNINQAEEVDQSDLIGTEADILPDEIERELVGEEEKVEEEVEPLPEGSS
jgi:DNA-directed RNA polymerase subunit omega